MTVAESLTFVQQFEALAGDLLNAMDVVLCPPYTALWPVAKALRGSRLQLGAQNVAPTADPARTGEISAALLADVGCRWVMLGHWEVRRCLGDDDEAVNRKVRLAFEAGLAPILLVGEARDDARDDPSPLEVALERQLARAGGLPGRASGAGGFCIRAGRRYRRERACVARARGGWLRRYAGLAERALG